MRTELEPSLSDRLGRGDHQSELTWQGALAGKSPEERMMGVCGFVLRLDRREKASVFAFSPGGG